ncbi:MULTISPECIES: hypothetical protein [Rhodomicrobium]|uniref:hypothetical protein n=1 Tax=Rhodomicrobium TaxID=1068 RepID=UPI000F73773B|nr:MULTISPECIES: hypothetical protein [Rhodomicrobium]
MIEVTDTSDRLEFFLIVRGRIETFVVVTSKHEPTAKVLLQFPEILVPGPYCNLYIKAYNYYRGDGVAVAAFKMDFLDQDNNILVNGSDTYRRNSGQPSHFYHRLWRFEIEWP